MDRWYRLSCGQGLDPDAPEHNLYFKDFAIDGNHTKKKHSHVFIHVTAGMNGLRGTLRVHCPLRGLTMDFQSIGITLKRQSYPFIHVIPFKRYFLQYTASFEDFRWISYPLESHSKTFACLFPCNPNLEVHFTVHCLLWGLWNKVKK